MTNATARPISTPPTAETRNPPPTCHTLTEPEIAAIERPQRDDRGRVVDQALALEDRDDPPRHPDPPGDRRRRHRVRRRDHRAEREAHRRASRRSNAHTTSPTPTVVNSTRPTLSSAIGRRFVWKSISDVRIDAAYSSGGSRPTSTISGVSSKSGTNVR